MSKGGLFVPTPESQARVDAVNEWHEKNRVNPVCIAEPEPGAGLVMSIHKARVTGHMKVSAKGLIRINASKQR